MPYPRTIAWDVSTATVPDALERYLIAMADIYEVSGISDEDQANFYNHMRSTLSAVGGIGTGRSVPADPKPRPRPAEALVRRWSEPGHQPVRDGRRI